MPAFLLFANCIYMAWRGVASHFAKRTFLALAFFDHVFLIPWKEGRGGWIR